jgi:hypothetical protein
MEIAPIAGVRAISLQGQPKAATTEEQPFQIEASARLDDDTYSHDGKPGESGLNEASSDEASSDEANSDEASSDEANSDEASSDEANSDEASSTEPTSSSIARESGTINVIA